MPIFKSSIPLLLVLLLTSVPVHSIDTDRVDVQAFIDRMVSEHDYDRAIVTAALKDASSQQAILDAISRPAEKSKEWYEYRAIFLTDQRIQAGADFWLEHEATLTRISSETGVPTEMLVGIIGVETYFGRITGKYRVIDALSTLAFDYPKRSKFFTRELEQFLLLVREENMSASEATGSYAGAMGRPQFMPSSYRAYAVDSTNDGHRDIWDNWDDVIGSVANYFVRHGWNRGDEVVAQATLGPVWQGEVPANQLKAKSTVLSLSEKGVLFSTCLPGSAPGQLLSFQNKNDAEYWVGFHNFFVITRYNTSAMYALAAHQLGQEIALEVEKRVE